MPADRQPTAEPIADLSVVIPTLESSGILEPLLRSVAPVAGEVWVVDGQSHDHAATASHARALGARFAKAPRGRGTQIRAGCVLASRTWLLILHADSSLPAEWADTVRAFVTAPEHRHRAAYFRLAFDEDSWPARRTAALANLRSRLLALPYGDQGLLISRTLLDEIGGFRDLPIMEDVDIVRRIGRRRLCFLGAAIRTSAERYRRDGWLGRSLRNGLCLALWFAGTPPERILNVYQAVAAARSARAPTMRAACYRREQVAGTPHNGRPSMLDRICGMFLLALAVVVAVHTVADPLFHTSSETQPYSPLWAILNPLMVLGIALGLLFSYARKRRVDGEPDSGPVTREFLIANTQFFGFVAVGILMLWNWFNLLSPAFTAIGADTASLVWILIDATLPLLFGSMGMFLVRNSNGE